MNFIAVTDLAVGMVVQFSAETTLRVVDLRDQGEFVTITWWSDGRTSVTRQPKRVRYDPDTLNGWSDAHILHDPNSIDEVPL